jgi:hypothetical protein
VQSAGKQVDPADEIVQSIRDDLLKTDPGAGRRVVDRLNSYLPRAGADRRPELLSAAGRARLQQDFGFGAEEIIEIGRSEFTSVDAHYLAESLLFRDIARSLDVERLPPVARAEAALAWVIRNLRGIPPVGPAVPAEFAAMRGAGTPVERTYVLLTLVRQLGLDAALIGDPGAGANGVWAVGVLADGQIYLFDARLGLPLPGPEGKGVLTLAQARTAADAFKPLALDPKLAYDVTPQRATAAEVLLTAPLSALSPRMRFLQEIAGEQTVRIAADPEAERDRFRKAVGADGPKVRLWCPPVPDAFPRLLFAFLPSAEGGGDGSAPSRQMQYYRSRLPLEAMPPFLGDLQGEPGNRVVTQFAAMAVGLDLPGQARDRILRGQFREATDQLVEVQSRAKRRSDNVEELEENAREWAKAAREYAADLSRKEKGSLPPAEFERLDQNRRTAERLWQSARGPQALLEYRLSDRIAAHATYLLALCKHEEAERTESPAAWATPQHWWRSFLTGYPEHPNVPAARRNFARALEAGGKRDAARAEYLSLAESAPSPLERLAGRYLGEKLK